MLRCGIDDGLDMVAEGSCGRVEIDAAEVIADGVELMTALGQGAGRTEIERAAVGREDGEGLIDRVLLEKGRKQQFIFLNIIDLEVGGIVKDLDTVAVGTVERLFRDVGRIGNIAA